MELVSLAPFGQIPDTLATLRFVDRVLHFDGVSARDLIARFGSPLYVYETSILQRQTSRLRTAFGRMPFRPMFAMKANSNLAILRYFAGQEFGADAVSPGEVFLARRAGFPAERIWFTCSNVSDADLLALADPKIIINVNSVVDIDRCLKLKLPNAIAIRVNPDVGAGHHRDVITGGFGVKFGIDLGELQEARIIAEDGGLQVVGIHAHIGSGVGSPAPLLDAAKVLLAESERFRSLKFINFGGGIGVPYRPDEREFPLDEYGAGLTELALPVLQRRGAAAILEPGRYLVAQAGTLLATVTTRRVSAGYEWLGCDSGFNHLVRPSKYAAYHHILNATNGDDTDLRDRFTAGTSHAEVIVAGNLCESGDVFTRGESGLEPRTMQRAKEGDVLAFCDAGAYGFSMASHYNARMLPAEVLVADGDAKLVRQRQTFDDLLLGQIETPELTTK